jgi:outer membrane protein assembly factor BamB
MSSLSVSVLTLCVFLATVEKAHGKDEPQNWTQWRGPLSTGAAPDADPPVEWSETKNVRWKTALPGVGHSTPVVVGNRIFVTAAVPYGKALTPKPDTAPGAHDNVLVTHHHKSVVICVARDTGKILWERTVDQRRPHEGGHYTGSLASASPVTDGESVYAFFGSRGLYCLDLDGKLRWKKDFGKMSSKHAHGEGSSPVLHGDTVVVNWDHEAQSFIVAFDKKDGAQRWRAPRDEVTSWATPIVFEHNGKPQLIVSGTTRVRSYDLASGKVNWECGGLSHNVVASPVAGDGMVFLASSYETRAMFAIRLDGAKGDITGSDHVVWTLRRSTPYVPSPLLYRGSLYFLRHYQGILSRVDAKTGKAPNAPTRLAGLREIYASPVAAAGRVYVTGRAGTTVVVSHEDQPKILALNRLDDRFNASAVLVDGEILLRGERHLYSIAEPVKSE